MWKNKTFRVVDLTQPLSPRTPRSVDHPQVMFEEVRWYARHGLRTNQITASLHSGTHVDAPSVYIPGGANIDDLPIDQFLHEGVILHLPRDDWGVIDAHDLERARPEIRAADIVVLVTGWHKYYFADQEKYQLKQPGLNRRAVDWLVTKHVAMVCADQPSAEHIFMHIARWDELRRDVFAGVQFDPNEFPPAYAHKQLLGHGILMCDHIGGDVDTVLDRRCMLGIFPARYVDVEGAPARAVAILDA